MTNSISSTIAVNAAATSTNTSDAITNATQKQLEALKIDTTNIKTETEAKAAIKLAQKKLELQKTTQATQPQSANATKDIKDTVEISPEALKASTSKQTNA